MLNQEEQSVLLAIARDAIVSAVSGSARSLPDPVSPVLCALVGCFVTIKQQGQLRGCIGNFVSDDPLYQLVREMAVSAALHDPRFYPMKKPDLDDFELEISVLSPLELVESVDEIQVGTHGIYLVKGTYRGVLLPQVASEYGWDRETFLAHTCLKAGLPQDAWRKGCQIYRFTAQVFGEQ